jgi:hypothetical protein
MPVKNIFSILIAVSFLAACVPKQVDAKSPDYLANNKDLIIGVWAKKELNMGKTEAVEFRKNGQLLMHTINCVKSAQEEKTLINYDVVDSGSVVKMIFPKSTVELNVVSFSSSSMQLSVGSGGVGENYDYDRVKSIDVVCEHYANLNSEKKRNTPYKKGSFVESPILPTHPGMDRYVGKWAANKYIEFEISKDASGKYFISAPIKSSWHYMYNNVHWTGDSLGFNVYTYSDDENLFLYPKHKLETPNVITLISDDVMQQQFILNGDPYLGTLTKIK